MALLDNRQFPPFMETPTPKKVRALPRVWKRFFQLKAGEEFYEGNCLRMKTGPFWCRSCARLLFFVAPWRRVRTTVYVRDARPGGKTSADVRLFGVGLGVSNPDGTFKSNLGETVRPVNSDDNRTGPSA
jgi:hypothetical protein